MMLSVASISAAAYAQDHKGRCDDMKADYWLEFVGYGERDGTKETVWIVPASNPRIVNYKKTLQNFASKGGPPIKQSMVCDLLPLSERQGLPTYRCTLNNGSRFMRTNGLYAPMANGQLTKLSIFQTQYFQGSHRVAKCAKGIVEDWWARAFQDSDQGEILPYIYVTRKTMPIKSIDRDKPNPTF